MKSLLKSIAKNKGLILLAIIIILCIMLGILGNISLDKKVDNAYNTPKKVASSGDASGYNRTLNGQGDSNIDSQQEAADKQKEQENQQDADLSGDTDVTSPDDIDTDDSSNSSEEHKVGDTYEEDGDLVTVVSPDDLVTSGQVDD